MSTTSPYNVIGSGLLQSSSKGTVAFEGEAYGSEVSMYLIEYREVGDGPSLHKHPYAETWVVRSGNARFTVGDEVIDSTSGAILVGPAEVPHMFKNEGPGNRDIICTHPSSRFIQEDLADTD
ncbi:MAG: cupin domain-containing protein [Actinomycetota bacterium]